MESMNLKGFMVGNGCTNWNYDARADPATYANFNVIPQRLWQEYGDLGCYMPGDVDLGTLDKKCAPLELKI